jgi:hypothetical protein
MMKNLIIVGLLFIIMPVVSYGQVDSAAISLKPFPKEPKTVRYPHLYLGFSVGGGIFGLGLDKKQIELKNKPAYSGNVFLELKITSWLGIETGGGYTYLSGSSSIANYSQTYSGVKDDEGETLDLNIKASGVEEEFTAGLLEIPVSLRLELNPGRWTFYLKPGVSYTMALNTSYTQKGFYSRTGYYPAYNVLFTNLPQHGFYNEKYLAKSSGEIDINNSVNPFIGAGIIFPGTSGRLFIEGKYYPGSVDFKKKSVKDQLPFDGNGFFAIPSGYSFSSVTKVSDKITMEGFIVQLGFRF